MKVNIGTYKSLSMERTLRPFLAIFGYHQYPPLVNGEWTDECERQRDEFDEAVERFENTLLGRLTLRYIRWYNNSAQRKIKVKMDSYDSWDLYVTLSHIIHPALIDFKKNQTYGIFWVEDEDVPESLRIGAPTKDTDGYTEEKMHWVLDEMIWTFNELITEEEYSACFNHHGSGLQFSDPDSDGYCQVTSMGVTMDKERIKGRRARVENGLRLFGKYFQSLWT